jgi:HAE1 family hydrophobic/amphiphilic exporter-1
MWPANQQSAGRVLQVDVDREVASRLGINPAVVDSLLYDAFGQRVAAKIYATLNEYYVILEVDPSFQLGPDALSRIYSTSGLRRAGAAERLCQGNAGHRPARLQSPGPVPIRDPEPQSEPEHLHRRGSDRDPECCRRTPPPPSIAESFQGSAQAFQSSLGSTPILILAALVAVYIILGILYESTIHPITIISTLPSAGLAALLTLLLFGLPLDVIGIIGIILLIGIVRKTALCWWTSPWLASASATSVRRRRSTRRASSLSTYPDDNHVRPARRHSSDARHRRRLGDPPASGLRHRR